MESLEDFYVNLVLVVIKEIIVCRGGYFEGFGEGILFVVVMLEVVVFR